MATMRFACHWGIFYAQSRKDNMTGIGVGRMKTQSVQKSPVLLRIYGLNMHNMNNVHNMHNMKHDKSNKFYIFYKHMHILHI
jgi:hypothetical protein